MGRVITVGNQKGGVGKTTTAVNLAAAYAKLGHRVLLIDMDSQGDASKYLAWKRDDGPTVFDLFRAYASDTPVDYRQAIRRSEAESLDFIPADARLDMVDTLLAEIPFRESVLRNILSEPAFRGYDYIFLDMSSRFASLLLNGLVASESVVIPVEPQEWSYDGIAKMLQNIAAVKKSANPDIYVAGILLTKVTRTVLGKSVIRAVKQKYSHYVLPVEMPSLVEVPESQNLRRSLVNTSGSKIGQMYIQCAEELLKKEAAMDKLRQTVRRAAPAGDSR